MSVKALDARVYTIGYSHPRSDGGDYSADDCIGVIVLARDMEDAISKFKTVMPDVHIRTCQHRGAISLLSDHALAQILELLDDVDGMPNDGH